MGPTMYTALVTAEAFGQSGKAQVVDLFLNNNNQVGLSFSRCLRFRRLSSLSIPLFYGVSSRPFRDSQLSVWANF